MKLSQYAKKLGVTYRTAWNYFKAGKLNAYQLPSGTIIVDENKPKNKLIANVAIYSRVSSTENKNNLDKQAERLINYSIAKGYIITKIIKEIGSGINDNRKQLNNLLINYNDYDKIIVEHKDRLTRFGFNYLNILLNNLGKEIEVVNQAEDDKKDLIQDFVSIITSYCARIYGLRRSKRKTEQLIENLKK